MKKLLVMIPTKGKTPKQIAQETLSLLKTKGMLSKEGKLATEKKESYTEYERREDNILDSINRA